MITMGSMVRKLAGQIARREGKKSQARIGDIREILGILADMLHGVPDQDLNSEKDPHYVLQVLGAFRAKKRKKK